MKKPKSCQVWGRRATNNFKILRSSKNDIDLHKESIEKGVEMNHTKTKIISNTNNVLIINTDEMVIEHVQDYLYLGQNFRINK